MNPHMMRQAGPGDFRKSMDPFNPHPLTGLLDASDDQAVTGFQNYLENLGAYMSPFSYSRPPVDPIDYAQGIATTELRAQLFEQQQQRAREKRRREIEQFNQKRMGGIVDSMTGDTLFNQSDRTGRKSRSL